MLMPLISIGNIMSGVEEINRRQQTLLAKVRLESHNDLSIAFNVKRKELIIFTLL